MTEARAPILVTRAEPVPGERWQDYAECVARAGGDPECAALSDFAGVEALAGFGGLLLTSGVDVDPARYGEARSERVRNVDAARDAFEEALLALALRRDVPVLAICRGHQLFNTARGGRLLQHLPEREPHRARRSSDGSSIASGWHQVRIAPGTLLARATGASALRVNSRHHQAVTSDGVAPGLVVSATAPDGVVEALEHPPSRFALSLQWHPELPEMASEPTLEPGSGRIFAAFVAACAGRAALPPATLGL